MLIASGRHAAATCPECASKLKTKLNIFSFSENKTFCATCQEKGCGAPVWEIRGIKDKYRISVNCPACGENHTYTISRRSFWGRDYFCLNCPTWEVGILYVGSDEDYIDRQMDMQDEHITEMLGGIADLDDTFSVMYDLIECINDIAKTNNIKCGCKSPDVTMGIDEDRVVLCCKNCGRKKVILSTEENIDYLLKAGTIVLDNTILNS